MSVDTLRHRYLYKVSASIISFAVSIIIQSALPRGLGPKAYGDLAFLAGILAPLVAFFDFGNLSGFYVKLSQRQNEIELIVFYTYFTAIGMLLFTIVMFSIAQFPYFHKQFFPGQEIFYIYIASIWAILARILQILNNMADAFGLTVKSEKRLIAQNIISLIIISTLYFSQNLNLTNYFLFQCFIVVILSTMLLWIMRQRGFFVKENWLITSIKAKEYIHEFYKYSHPLFISFLFGFVSGIFDRWLLQFFGGSVEQGFYGLSYQMSTVSTIFSGAMSMLIMREFSIAFVKKDFSQMAYLFQRFIPLMYAITAYIACFTVIQADNIILIVGGREYNGAYFAVSVMLFFPIHQVYGQLSGSVLLATGQTKLYARLLIISVFVGIPMVYFLVASTENFGLNLGAAGLAIKMVVIQIIFVNVQLFYNSQLLNLNFWKYLGHQIICVTCLIVISTLVMWFVSNGLNLENHIFISFLLSGMLYTGLVGILVYFQPIVFGITSQDLAYVKNLIIQKVKINRYKI
jgi:O-antigen/teichoic acid export membrane protein